MYLKFTEFIPQPTKRPAYYNQYKKPSHILHNGKTTLPRIETNQKLLCTINGCSNYRDRFGKVCNEHYKDKRKNGTYSPTTFMFKDDVSTTAKKLFANNYCTDEIIYLANKIQQLFNNPYSHTIEILKGARRGKTVSSKGRISGYIKKHYSKSMDTIHIAIRLGIVFKHFQDGTIEGGGQLRFNLSKALIPHTSTSGQGIQIKEVIGNIVIKNYTTELLAISEQL